MTKILLITEDLPSESYGTGQRVKLWQDAIEQVGECRILHLLPPGQTETPAHFAAPVVFDFRASRWQWLLWQASMGYFRPSRRHEAVLRAIHADYPFDLAVCSFYRSAPVAPLDLAPCILDADALPWPTGRISSLLWPATKRAMRHFFQRFTRVVVISRAEADAISLPGRAPDLLPGAVARIGAVPVPEAQRDRIVLFVGPYKWGPNREAIDMMLRSGLPERLHQAGYTLRFAGVGTDALPTRPGVSGGGFVDDLAAEYARAALVLCPIESGGGANIKLAEAIQYGCAVLSSAHSARGYDGVLEPGHHLRTYVSTATFADDVMALLGDEAALQALRRNAVEAGGSLLSPQRLKDRMAGWIRAALDG